MSDVLVKIEKTVPITIFELPQIKLRVDNLFNEIEDDIKVRFDEVKAFITKGEADKRIYGKIEYDEIATLFKIFFYKSVLNDVVEMTFEENDKYDVVKNILEILSYDKLKKAVLGEPMINGFKMAITNLPSDGGLTACLHGGKIMLLEKEFLGINVPY